MLPFDDRAYNVLRLRALAHEVEHDLSLRLVAEIFHVRLPIDSLCLVGPYLAIPVLDVEVLYSLSLAIRRRVVAYASWQNFLDSNS